MLTRLALATGNDPGAVSRAQALVNGGDLLAHVDWRRMKKAWAAGLLVSQDFVDGRGAAADVIVVV